MDDKPFESKQKNAFFKKKFKSKALSTDRKRKGVREMVILNFFVFLLLMFNPVVVVTADDGLEDKKITDAYVELKRDIYEDDKKERARDRQDRIAEKEAKDKADRIRAEVEAKKEVERARREAQKDMEEKCEQASKDVQEELKDKQGEAQDWEEKFHDKGQEITGLEEELSKQQIQLREQLDDLKKNSNQNLQDLKDNMGREMEGLEDQVVRLEAKISDLNTQLEKIEDARLTAYYARRKQQNESYSNCFGQALTQTEAQRTAFYQKKQQRRVKRKSMGELMTGGKQQNKNVFAGKFNSYLHLCLNNEAALLAKQNLKDEYKLSLEKMKREEQRTKKQIEGVRVEIQKLQTTEKAEVLSKFKEKMEAQLKSFNQSYDVLSTNYKANAQQVLQQIEKIKKVQASYLMKRAQAVPQKTRSVAISAKCQQVDAFNLFQNQDSGRGAFNSSRRRSDYDGPGRDGSVR